MENLNKEILQYKISFIQLALGEFREDIISVGIILHCPSTQYLEVKINKEKIKNLSKLYNLDIDFIFSVLEDFDERFIKNMQKEVLQKRGFHKKGLFYLDELNKAFSNIFKISIPTGGITYNTEEKQLEKLYQKIYDFTEK